MGIRCKGPDGTIRTVEWKRINNGYVPVITVCGLTLYNYTETRITCSEGQTLCNGQCVDLTSNNNNCGGCGNICDEGEECIDGECIDVSIPLVSTDSVDVQGFEEIILTGTIIDQGSTDVIEYGFVYSTETELPTLDDTVIIVGSESFTGEFQTSLDIEDPQFGQWYYFRAYATNNTATEYGDAIQEMPFICLIQGTQISLANGKTKSIENITYEDDLLVWNFDEGKFDTAKPVWIAKKFSMPKYNLVEFNNGSKLGTIAGNTGHSIFNANENKFTHLNSEETPVNTKTFSSDGVKLKITNTETIHEEIEFFNILTNHHMNMFADGILTSSTLNNIYPIENMKFVKDEKSLNSRESFDVTDEIFYGLRLNEQLISDKLIRKINILMKNQA